MSSTETITTISGVVWGGRKLNPSIFLFMFIVLYTIQTQTIFFYESLTVSEQFDIIFNCIYFYYYYYLFNTVANSLRHYSHQSKENNKTQNSIHKVTTEKQ